MKTLLKAFVHFARQYGLGRAILRTVFWITTTLLAPRHEIKIKLRNGCELFLVPKDIGISAELRVFKIHEPLATRSLVKALRKKRVVIDIGSNIGYYVSLESKIVGKNGQVIAIEPDPVNFAYLLKNIRLNQLTNVITVNKAISDREGIVNIVRSNRSNWSRVLQNVQDVSSKDIIDVIKVEATTIDTLIKQLGLERVDLIRMDVEGYEDYILNTSQSVLTKYLPDIFVEIHQFLIGKHRLMRLLASFQAIGYNTRCVIPRNVDFAFLIRNTDVINKDIGEIINEIPFEVFTVHLVARS
jgi:FkbM family methyltransferase